MHFKELADLEFLPSYIHESIRRYYLQTQNDPTMNFMLQGEVSMHRTSSLSNFLKNKGLLSPIMEKKLGLAHDLIYIKRIDADENELPTYGPRGLALTGIEDAVKTYMDFTHKGISDWDFLVSMVAFTIQQDTANGWSLDPGNKPVGPWNSTYENAEHVSFATQIAYVQDIVSRINGGKNTPDYRVTQENIHRFMQANGDQNVYFMVRLLQVLGFLMETEKDSRTLEDFALDCLNAVEQPVARTILPFCESLVEEVEKPNVDLFCLYRGSWGLQTIVEKIAAAKGFSIQDKLHRFYFTRKIDRNTTREKLIKYLYDQGLFKSSKPIFVECPYSS